MFAVALLATAAQALEVPHSSERDLEFAGEGCDSIDSATVSLPAGAHRIRIQGPKKGEFLSDPDGSTVARVLDSRVSKVGSRRRLLVRVRGAGEVCARPLDFPNGWVTDPVLARANYRVNRQVYVAAQCRGSAVRPGRIIVACGDGNLQLTELHWNAWGGAAATATGVALANTCTPSCAEGHFERIPAQVRLSRPRFCERTGHYQYLTLRASGGSLRGASTSFGYLC